MALATSRVTCDMVRHLDLNCKRFLQRFLFLACRKSTAVGTVWEKCSDCWLLESSVELTSWYEPAGCLSGVCETPPRTVIQHFSRCQPCRTGAGAEAAVFPESCRPLFLRESAHLLSCQWKYGQ